MKNLNEQELVDEQVPAFAKAAVGKQVQVQKNHSSSQPFFHVA
jgi:hypothetical protein